jgi:hypothetical protein
MLVEHNLFTAPESREDTHPRASQQLKKKSPKPHFHQLM